MSRRSKDKFKIKEVHYDEINNEILVDGYVKHSDGRQTFLKNKHVEPKYYQKGGRIYLFVRNEDNTDWLKVEDE